MRILREREKFNKSLYLPNSSCIHEAYLKTVFVVEFLPDKQKFAFQLFMSCAAELTGGCEDSEVGLGVV